LQDELVLPLVNEISLKTGGVNDTILNGNTIATRVTQADG
jgi:hypothetical protein